MRIINYIKSLFLTDVNLVKHLSNETHNVFQATINKLEKINSHINTMVANKKSIVDNTLNEINELNDHLTTNQKTINKITDFLN